MIITVGRQFGSGGRELGKRLADALGIPCYDKEIINEVAKLQGVTPEHVNHIGDSDIRAVYASTIGHTLTVPLYYDNSPLMILAERDSVIKRLASLGDCVIVGRNADVVLKDMHPLNLFVYADTESKLRRCMERAQEGETEKSILKQMKKIDKHRAANRRMATDSEWGQPESYHLCINTSGHEIKTLVPALAQYARQWFSK